MADRPNLETLWAKLSPDAQRLVGRVIAIEKEKLYMGLPRGVNDEILQALKEIVK